ncbi:MAG: hypothetical protein AB8G05_21480 [Oligoflexales bacterium]
MCFILNGAVETYELSFGNRLKKSLKEDLNSDRFSCHIKGNLFDLKVFKNGNVELLFHKNFHNLINNYYNSCQEMSLKQFILMENLSKHGFADSGKNASGFFLHQTCEDDAIVIKFELLANDLLMKDT